MSEWLFTIDPGKVFGWAVFCDGRLIASAHCSQTAFFKRELSGQATRAGMRLPWLPEKLPGDTWKLVAEKPNYHHQGAGKRSAPPNDLITLGVFLGELVSLYRRKGAEVEFVTAHGWKGSLDKEICHARLQKILGPDELFPENHNARDSVGIGLQVLGRYRR